MNTRSTKKQAQNRISIIWLVLIIGISACGPATPNTSFEYQVQVQAKDTGVELGGAQVRIEVASIAPLDAITDTHGTARIFIDSSRKNKPALLTVETSGYKKYVQNIDLRTDVLPAIIQLESELLSPDPTLTGTQVVTPKFDPTGKPLAPSPTSCPWILYSNGAATSSLSDENCLNDVNVKNIGVSEYAKQISFFVAGSPSGKYGVCRDISDQNNLEFAVMLRNDIASARFLVTLGPDPVPGKSAYAFRIQPEPMQPVPNREKEIYVKFIQYTSITSTDIDEEMAKIRANPNLINLGAWKFDFVFQFSGAKVTASVDEIMNQAWQLNRSSRYLCFAYESMPTREQSAQLDVRIQFP
jgi:hypothetical protein